MYMFLLFPGTSSHVPSFYLSSVYPLKQTFWSLSIPLHLSSHLIYANTQEGGPWGQTCPNLISATYYHYDTTKVNLLCPSVLTCKMGMIRVPAT